MPPGPGAGMKPAAVGPLGSAFLNLVLQDHPCPSHGHDRPVVGRLRIGAHSADSAIHVTVLIEKIRKMSIANLHLLDRRDTIQDASAPSRMVFDLSCFLMRVGKFGLVPAGKMALIPIEPH